jgi:SAM-dependent methyltransferase
VGEVPTSDRLTPQAEKGFIEWRDADDTAVMAEFEDYDPNTYQRSAHVYDVMNAVRGKSYPEEAATVLRLIRRRVPGARSLLDVACGTGLHLYSFRNDLEVEGIEPHPRLRAIARDRLTDVPVHEGDMRTFDLGRRFDVVTCLFSAIGYMLSHDDLQAAIRQMAAHVSPGGVLLVEPWFHPDAWIDGLVMAESATVDDLAIARLSHSNRDGHIAHFDFYWTVGRGPTSPGGSVGDAATSNQSGVEQWREPHRLGLWTDAEYRDAFTRVGLDVEHDPTGLIGRGLYLGYKPLD